MVYSPNKYRETEGIKVRRIGYALDVATLQQVAYNHGIETSIQNMTQAQKAQLRYIAIMEQSNNAMGDMARTIESPANQLRILESRIETLKRAIGDSLMPVLSAALPYVTAFVQIVGEAFRSLAEFLGFEVPEFDYSDLISKGNEDIASSFDDATAASEKFKGTLAGIDQLNIIGSKSDKSGSGDDGYSNDLNLDLPSYDFLGGLEAETSEAYDTLKGFLSDIAPVVGGIAATLAGLYVGDKVVKGLQSLGKGLEFLATTKIGKVASTITATVTAFIAFKNIVKDLVTGNGSVNKLALAIGGVSTAMLLFVATGNPAGAVLTAIGAGLGAIIGYEAGLREINAQIAETIMYADKGGISLEGLADGFSSYIDTISSGYSDILDNSKAMQENRDKIDEAAQEVYNLTDKYRNLGGEISAENAETIKSNIETIGNAVSDNLGTFTQGIVEQLQGQFHDFAVELGQDVDDMVGKFYLLESMGNTALANVKKEAQQLVNEITNGNLSADEMKQKLAELDNAVNKMSGTNTTAESVGFTRALENMDFAGIDFTDETSVKRIMSDFETKAKEARSAIEEAWNNQIVDLQNTKQQYINLGIDVEFDEKFGAGAFNKLFTDTEAVLNEGYASELKKIDVGQGAFVSMVQEQLNKNIAEAARATAPTFGDYFGANLSNIFTLKGINTDLADDKAEKSNLERITKQFADVQEVIDNAAGGLDLSESSDIGKYLLEGMANGAIDNSDKLNSALDAAAKGAMDEFKEICGIASPSKVFAEYGGYLMQGLVLGIRSGKSEVLQEIDNVANAVAERMGKINTNMPVYSSEQANQKLGGGLFSRITGAFASQPQYSGADAQTISDVGRAMSDSGATFNINVQSYVELDGEQVGYAVTQYQERQMAYSNGR
ncbi:MAG: hypothetical protein NC299_15785 [Lachnospiraceae bacterium]|nr:hypothetical protein [Lachnospiraceae bacterium]